jgi:HAMP domain-containing protein
MTRTKILALCGPVAAAGLALALHATFRVNDRTRALAELRAEADAAGASFVATLHGEHAERQRVLFERRRTLAIELASARRDRLLGVLLTAGSGLLGAALSVMSRIASEVDEVRRHVGS